MISASLSLVLYVLHDPILLHLRGVFGLHVIIKAQSNFDSALRVMQLTDPAAVLATVEPALAPRHLSTGF